MTYQTTILACYLHDKEFGLRHWSSSTLQVSTKTFQANIWPAQGQITGGQGEVTQGPEVSLFLSVLFLQIPPRLFLSLQISFLHPSVSHQKGLSCIFFLILSSFFLTSSYILCFPYHFLYYLIFLSAASIPYFIPLPCFALSFSCLSFRPSFLHPFPFYVFLIILFIT